MGVVWTFFPSSIIFSSETDERKNVQTTPTRTYCKRSRPLLYCNQNCRTPRHWKFTQHLRTTRPPPKRTERIDERKKNFQTTPTRTYCKCSRPLPVPTASAVGPCPTVIQIIGRPGTESLPSTIASPNHPR